MDQNSDICRLYKQFVAGLKERLPSEDAPATTKRGLQDLTDKLVRIDSKPFSYGAVTAVWSAELYGKQVTIFSHGIRKTPTNAFDRYKKAKEGDRDWTSLSDIEVSRFSGLVYSD